MMQDVLLLAVVAATFAFGWLLMGKLDHFLEENCHGQEGQPLSDGNTLRLGFCNPMAAGGMTDVLEQCSESYPDLSVRMFSGSEGELLKGLSAGRFDVIFLPGSAELPAHTHYNFQAVSLDYAPVMTKYGGFPIEPVTGGHMTQNVLWSSGTASAFTCCFLNHLEEKFTVPDQVK